ncbi:hypothetical protein [Undibacterium sp. TJN19]|uniref:hypothetical protein n=1 Tax=Undibacterium sp. TJN19 TaxID=3413055 RepID=UPI003BF3321C
MNTIMHKIFTPRFACNVAAALAIGCLHYNNLAIADEKFASAASSASAIPVSSATTASPGNAASSTSASSTSTASKPKTADTVSAASVANVSSATGLPAKPATVSSSKPAVTSVQVGIPSALANTPNYISYEKAWRRSALSSLSHAVILQLQQQMGLIYHDLSDWKHDFALPEHPLSDGILGPITQSWLQRLCFNFKTAIDGDLAGRLPSTVARVAAFTKLYPAESAILISPDFESWDNAEPEPQRSQDFQVRRQGSDAELLALVRRYLARKKTRPNNNLGDDYREPNTIYTYTLTADDLTMLGGKDHVILALTTLKDKEFDSVDALKAAVNQALGNRAQLYKQLWPTIERQVMDVVGYKINQTKLAELKKQNVDDAILKALAKLNDNYFQDRTELEANISDALKDFSPEEIAATTAKLVKIAEVVDGVQLNAQSLLNLKNDLKGDIRNASVPAVIIKMLKEIQDVQYPDQALFNSAAKAKILYSIATCKKDLPRGNQYVAGLRVSDDELALLKTELTNLESGVNKGKPKPDLNAIFDQFSKSRGRLEECSKEELKTSDDGVDQIFDSYLATVVDNAARKNYPDPATPIQWDGGACGCVLDTMAAGVVYGFYPFWANQGKVQLMNFSMLNRVAYYGLSVDNLGELRQSNDFVGGGQFKIDDGSAQPNGFISTARDYNTKVDWVVQKADWSEWNKYPRESKQAVMQRLANNIVTLLHTPLTDKFSKALPYLTLGFNRTPRRGDGVTLYFSDYPKDADSALIFNEFYASLKQGLTRDKISINILLSRPSLEDKDSAFGMSNLIKLRKVTRQIEAGHDKPSAAHKDYYLILLDEPSTDSKKKLRHDIDINSNLSGADRVDFLLGIVPVLQFDNRNWQQLESDIAYMNYNFGGIGFWPLPIANLAKPVPAKPQSCIESEQVLMCLVENLNAPGMKNELPSILARQVCEHRWTLIILMNCFIIAIALMAYLYFRYCPIQNIVRQYFLWVLLLVLFPPIIIFMLLLFYDPSWSALSSGNLPFIIAVAIIILGTLGGYLYLRSQREKPQRQRAVTSKKKPRE